MSLAASALPAWNPRNCSWTRRSLFLRSLYRTQWGAGFAVAVRPRRECLKQLHSRCARLQRARSAAMIRAGDFQRCVIARIERIARLPGEPPGAGVRQQSHIPWPATRPSDGRRPSWPELPTEPDPRFAARSIECLRGCLPNFQSEPFVCGKPPWPGVKGSIPDVGTRAGLSGCKRWRGMIATDGCALPQAIQFPAGRS